MVIATIAVKNKIAKKFIFIEARIMFTRESELQVYLYEMKGLGYQVISHLEITDFIYHKFHPRLKTTFVSCFMMNVL